MTHSKAVTLSPERVQIMQWTARMGAVTAEALADREDTSVASARGRLQALVSAKWLSRKRLLADRPALYTLTPTGMRVCALKGLDPCRVSASNAGHLIECARVAAALERCYPDHVVLGERELRRDEREGGVICASARLGDGLGGAPLLHRPDLVLRPLPSGQEWDRGAEEEEKKKEGVPEPEVPDRLPVPVEVELTVKAPERLTAICRAWARCRTVAGVLYIAPPEVQRALERAITRAQAQEQIVVVGFDALPERRAPDTER
jgi:hypothetical protein